jgi:hypothetical protein
MPIAVSCAAAEKRDEIDWPTAATPTRVTSLFEWNRIRRGGAPWGGPVFAATNEGGLLGGYQLCPNILAMVQCARYASIRRVPIEIRSVSRRPGGARTPLLVGHTLPNGTLGGSRGGHLFRPEMKGGVGGGGLLNMSKIEGGPFPGEGVPIPGREPCKRSGGSPLQVAMSFDRILKGAGHRLLRENVERVARRAEPLPPRD